VRPKLGPPGRRGSDEAAVEVLIDAAASPDARQHAARALGLAGVPLVRAVALVASNRIEPAIRAEPQARPDLLDSGGQRAGIGMAVSVDGLPASWAAARTALRLTASGRHRLYLALALRRLRRNSP